MGPKKEGGGARKVCRCQRKEGLVIRVAFVAWVSAEAHATGSVSICKSNACHLTADAGTPSCSAKVACANASNQSPALTAGNMAFDKIAGNPIREAQEG